MKLILVIIIFSSIAKINGFAQTFNWVDQIGSNNYEYSKDVTVDNKGNIFTIGVFSDTVDFDPGPGVYNLISNGSSDCFIQKLDSNGNFIWAKHFGSLTSEYPTKIMVDVLGNIFIVGSFYNTCDFDPSIGIYNLTANNGDAFLLRLNSFGNFIWAKQFGGPGDDKGNGLYVDGTNVLITGYFIGSSDFDPNAGTFTVTSVAGSYDGFIEKLDYVGNMIWVKTIGDIYDDAVLTVAEDLSGNIYIGGNYLGTMNFNPGSGSDFHTSTASSYDFFIIKLNSIGNYTWGKSFGGNGYDEITSIKKDLTGNVIATGFFSDTVDFDPGTSINLIGSNGGFDFFLLILNSSGNYVLAEGFGGVGHDYSYELTLDNSGNYYLTGNYFYQADFDPGAGVYLLNSVGQSDGFCVKVDATGQLLWAISMGGIWDGDSGTGVTSFGNSVIVCGNFEDICDFDPGIAAHELTSLGNVDVFILKLSTQYVGVLEKKSDLTLKFFPNPSNSLINIEFEIIYPNQTIQMYSSDGKLVLNQNIQQLYTVLDISNLETGVYYLNSIVDDKIMREKIIIQHAKN